MSAPKRLLEFDLLRVVAIVYIVSFRHIDDYINDMFTSPVNDIFVYILLGLFVFMSGFLIATSYPSLSTKKEIYSFIVKRLLRIYPLYLIALSLYLIYYLHQLSLVNVLAHVFCLNLLLWPVTGESFRTLWFIALILQYYLIYPYLSRLEPKKLWLWVFATYSLLLSVHIFFHLVDERVFIYLPVFALGISAARAGIVDRWTNGVPVLASFILTIAIAVSFAMVGAAKDWLGYILQTLLMMVAIFPAWKLARLICASFKFDNFIAKLSYAAFCMYLFHRAIYRALLLLYTPQTVWLTIVYLFIVGLPLVYVFGFGIQTIYDRFLGLVFSLAQKSESLRS